jgi:hypothetical protein
MNLSNCITGEQEFLTVEWSTKNNLHIEVSFFGLDSREEGFETTFIIIVECES